MGGGFMNRRRYLSTLGVGLLAGCNGSKPGEPTPAESPTSTVETDTPAMTETPTTTPTATTTPIPSPELGVSLSPRSFQDEDITDFFEQAGQAGSLVRWAGDWADLSNPEGAASVVATLGETYGYRPMVSTGVFSVDREELFRPLDGATQAELVRTIADFVGKHEPPYLEFGVEVNSHWETDPESFETYVGLFERVATAIESASPATAILVTFQLERLAGLQGGLFGGENDPDLAQWDLLDRFPAADVIGLTTYPGLIYHAPDDIPADYFARVADRVDRPLAITETGWSATTVAPDWESNEATQAAFVEWLFETTAGVDLVLALWAFVYAPTAAPEAFRGMGLRRADGSVRPAWDAWVARADAKNR